MRSFVYEDVDDDLIPADESKVVGEKGDPPPELLSDPGDRTAFVLGTGRRRAVNSLKRPQPKDLGRLGARFAPYDAVRLRARGYGSDEEDQIHTSNYFALLSDGVAGQDQHMSQDVCLSLLQRSKALRWERARSKRIKNTFFLKGFYFGTKFDKFVCFSVKTFSNQMAKCHSLLNKQTLNFQG